MANVKAKQLSPTFQQNLKAIREARDMSQRALAIKMGSNQATISELENGRASPTLAMIERLCESLDVDSDVLLTAEGADIFLSATA